MPEHAEPAAAGYSIQSLFAAVERASTTLPAPGYDADAGRPGSLPAAEQKPKVRARQAATVAASARVKTAAEDVKPGRSGAAGGAAAAGMPLAKKRKRDAQSGSGVTAGSGVASKRSKAAARKVEVAQQDAGATSASMPTVVKVSHLLSRVSYT